MILTTDKPSADAQAPTLAPAAGKSVRKTRCNIAGTSM